MMHLDALTRRYGDTYRLIFGFKTVIARVSIVLFASRSYLTSEGKNEVRIE